MIFNSVTFLIFFTGVSLLYWLLPSKPRYWLLFLSSILFYAFWRWEYLSVLLISAGVDYFVALRLERVPAEQKSLRKRLLAISLTVNLGLLFYFKYLLFFTDNLNAIFQALGAASNFPHWNIILPFGISFYTFETISYTMDVYRGHIKAEKNFLSYGLFIAFFPKLVAGPIQRAAELIGQLKLRPGFRLEFVSEGLRRIIQGLFLKVVFADNIAPLVDEGFAMDARTLGGIDVATLAFLFGFQIYFDFSAYSHIALGAARVLGIDIPENFNYPYIARSMKEFWKRWHISLSSWIRDYLYLPLTGTKVMVSTGRGGIGQSLGEEPSRSRKNLALFATWAIMGFWHGANWTFILWGLYHAFFIFLERQLTPLRERIPVLASTWVTWPITLVIAMLSWIPFRATDLTDTFTMFGKLLNPGSLLVMNMRENTYLVTMIILLCFLISWFATTWVRPRISSKPLLLATVDLALYTVMILGVFIFLRPINQFIYFQF
jgi:alginate O-acetyltransferase complex protein AlgI